MSRSWRHGRATDEWPWWKAAWRNGKEWWGKRPLSMHSPSRRYNWWFKRRLHKLERRQPFGEDV